MEETQKKEQTKKVDADRPFGIVKHALDNYKGTIAEHEEIQNAYSQIVTMFKILQNEVQKHMKEENKTNTQPEQSDELSSNEVKNEAEAV